MQYDKGNFRISQHGRHSGHPPPQYDGASETGGPLEGRPSASLGAESAHEFPVFWKSFHASMERFIGMAAEAQYAEILVAAVVLHSIFMMYMKKLPI